MVWVGVGLGQLVHRHRRWARSLGSAAGRRGDRLRRRGRGSLGDNILCFFGLALLGGSSQHAEVSRLRYQRQGVSLESPGHSL